MDTRKIMHFLKGIAANNNREWFQENKTEFEAVKANFEEGVDKVIACLSTFDDEVSHLTAKDCTYRFTVMCAFLLIKVLISVTLELISVGMERSRFGVDIIFICSRETASLLWVVTGFRRISLRRVAMRLWRILMNGERMLRIRTS